jgi:hypothetical protein
MVLPSLEARKSLARNQGGKTANKLLMIFAAASAFMTLISIFGPTLYVVEHQHDEAAVVMNMNPKLLIRSDPLPSQPELAIIEVEDLAHEELFYNTIKSCIPAENKKCKEFVPDNGEAKKVQRVALVSPPGDIALSLHNRMEQVMLQHNHRHSKDSLDIDIITTSHVPPYGYGKTHGLTKLVRLVPQPLTLEVTDALQTILEPGESHKNITLQDLKAATRQILRFHCRISHVSAHTATLSIPFMDLLSDPRETTQAIQSFLAPGDTFGEKGTDDERITESVADDDQAGLFDAEEKYGTQILTYIQSVSHVNVNEILDQVLLEELKKTKNMTQWPCPSFWAAGDEPDPLKLSPITMRLARALSPDCGAPFASCFVPRDKCEEKGDGLCKGNK